VATLSIGAPVGEHVGCSFTGNFERQMKEGSGNGPSLITLILSHFLDPDCVMSLSVGAIWNCCEGPGLP